MEIVPGIYKLKVPIPDNPLGFLNSYLVRGDKGCLLIDAGWNTDEAFNSLEDQLRALGLGFHDIATIVFTHVHPDHYGLAGRIKQVSPVKLALHLWEKALIESRYIHFNELRGKIGNFLRSHGVPEETTVPMESASMPAIDFVSVAWPDEVLYGGETYTIGEFQIEVIWTPGHSPGHICLYEPNKKLLFAGDHVLANITPNISYHLQSGSNPLGDYINSLHHVRCLPVNKVLPAHGEVFDNLEERIDNIIQHHEERKNRILSMIANEGQTAFAIAYHLPWNVPGNQLQTLGALQQRFAVMETIAHLELMRMEGRIERTIRDGIIYYAAFRSTK